MKIAKFNINNVNRRLPNLLDRLRTRNLISSAYRNSSARTASFRPLRSRRPATMPCGADRKALPADVPRDFGYVTDVTQ